MGSVATGATASFFLATVFLPPTRQGLVVRPMSPSHRSDGARSIPFRFPQASGGVPLRLPPWRAASSMVKAPRWLRIQARDSR